MAAKALIVAVMCSTGLSAQSPPMAVRALSLADSSVARIMESARRAGVPQAVIADVIRQRSGAYPLAKRRELADSIADLVIRGDDPTRAGVIALDIAGRADSAFGGQPEPYALVALARIARSPADTMSRVIATYALAYQTSPERAIPELAQLATLADDVESRLAILQLQSMATQIQSIPTAVKQLAMGALKQLLDDCAVTSRLGLVTLGEVASQLKWNHRGCF